MSSYAAKDYIGQASSHSNCGVLGFPPMCVDKLLLSHSTESKHDDRNQQQQPTSVDCMVQTKPKIGTYMIERTLGRGIFSIVKLATHTITGLNVAIKIIDKTRLDSDNKVKIYRESEILKKLHHLSIVKLFQVMETARLLFVVMEYLPNGELFEYIAKHGRFTEAEARMKFIDILTAIDYAHFNGIVHRDIKAENVLFDANMNLKLIDFSFGTRHHPSGSATLLNTWCGSPPYAAPEIFKGEPYIGTKADIWSLGVVLYVMVCGTLPFDAQPLLLLKNQVLSACFRVPYWLSTVCEQLIRWMLSKLPLKRPSTREIFQHPWLTRPVPGTNTIPQLPKRSLQSTSSTRNPATDLAPSVDASRINSIELPFNTSSPNHSTHFLRNHHQKQCIRQSDVVSPGDMYIASDNLAADIEMGRINHLVLLIMESYGMQRTQILESLGRCAYDHLMATYLLLGEKLHRHRGSLPQIIFPVLPTVPMFVSTEKLSTMPISSSEMDNSYLHPKHSRADSAVDMKTSVSESEYLLDASTPSLNLLEYEPVCCPSNELINLPYGHVNEHDNQGKRNYDESDSSLSPFPQPWPKHLSDVPQLTQAPSVLKPLVSTFHPLKLQPPTVSENIPNVSLSSSPLSTISAMPTDALSIDVGVVTNSLPPFERVKRDTLQIDAQLTNTTSIGCLPTTSLVSTDSNVDQRCSLVRRKYGVATPPVCMARLIGLFDNESNPPIPPEQMDEAEDDYIAVN